MTDAPWPYGEKYYLNKEGRVAIKPEFFPYQATDGTPHLAYFDERTQASFIWDGKSESIQVCIGGYGEPVDHEIPTPAFGRPGEQLTPIALFYSFAQACRAHAETLDAS